MQDMPSTHRPTFCLWMKIQPLWCRGLQHRKSSRGHRLMMRQQMAKSTLETRKSRDARSNLQRCHITFSKAKRFPMDTSELKAPMSMLWSAMGKNPSVPYGCSIALSTTISTTTIYYSTLFFFSQVCDWMKLRH